MNSFAVPTNTERNAELHHGSVGAPPSLAADVFLCAQRFTVHETSVDEAIAGRGSFPGVSR